MRVRRRGSWFWFWVAMIALISNRDFLQLALRVLEMGARLAGMH